MDEQRMPLFGLIGEVGSKAAALMRAELQVFGLEMRQKLSVGVQACVWFAAAGLLLLYALALGLAALVLLLVDFGFKPVLAAAMVGVVAAIVGVVLFMVGRARMRTLELVPQQTLNQLRQDVDILKRSASSV